MAEYTDLSCSSPEIANAVWLYLNEQINEQEEPPLITAYVNKSTVRVTYGDNVTNVRREWDMQLIGYRDGLMALNVTASPTVESALAQLREKYPDEQLIVSVRDCGEETMTLRGTTLEWSIQVGMNGKDFDADTLTEALSTVLNGGSNG